MKIVDPATGQPFDRVLDDTPETIAAKVAAARRPSRSGRPDRWTSASPSSGRSATSWSATPTTWPPPSPARRASRSPRATTSCAACCPHRLLPRRRAAGAGRRDGAARTADRPRSSPTSRSGSSPTSRPGTTRTSSGRTCSSRRCWPATPCSTSRPSTPRSPAWPSARCWATPACPSTCSPWWWATGPVGAELLAHRARRRLLHRLVRAPGRRIAEAMAGQLDPGAARAGGQGPGLRVRRRRRGRGRPRAWPTARSTTTARAAAPSSASTSTADVHDAFVDAVRGRGRRVRDGRPDRRDAPISVRSPEPSRSTCSRRRWPTRWPAARRVVRGGKRVADRPGALVRADRADRGDARTWRSCATRASGPIIGIQAVADDDEAVARMADTDYGLTAGVYTPDEARARSILAPPRRRLGLLELL